ncbi:MAG: division/cell wall cluster transcriptional repressor MraZ [Dehalococcoidales bacterium]|jgi:MraZ protein|nr:division/cell wall cluster transcriptional repressor MraZ [Dehalococcoidales bacterium]
MFLGEYNYKIDEKGRIPLPPKFRAEFRDGIVLATGAENCILVYSPAQWKILAENLTTGPVLSSKMRKLNRALFATAFHLNLDGQGRIALPMPLRQYAGITSDVVIAGANIYLEIWDKQAWELEKAESQAQSWQIIETMEKH